MRPPAPRPPPWWARGSCPRPPGRPGPGAPAPPAARHADRRQAGRPPYEPPDSFVDLPATSGEGAVVTASAEVGLLAPPGPAAVTLADQRTDGEEVVVGEVTLPAPGFVALQAEVDGVPGVILGLSGLLPAGATS